MSVCAGAIWLSVLILVIHICSAVQISPTLSTVPGYSTLPPCAQNALHYYFSDGYFAQCNLNQPASDYGSCLCNAGSSSFDFELSSWRQEFCSTISPGGNQVFNNYCSVLDGSLAPVGTGGSATTTTANKGGAANTAAASPGSSVSSAAPTATGSNSGETIGTGSTGTGNGGCVGITGNGDSCTIETGHNGAVQNVLSPVLCGVWLVSLLLQLTQLLDSILPQMF